jgi:hypothetical protein
MHRLIFVAHLSFTTPAMWAGVTLAAFPLVAHLLNRYAHTRRIFPSLLLLRQSVAQQARLAKWRRWLLLGLRCLFVVAMAAAFARPVWRSRQLDAAAATARNGVVILLDASGSMQVVRDGVSRFEVAKAAGHRILGELRRGTDVANLIVLAAEPHPVFGELSPNLPALQDELRRETVTEESADIVAGMQLASRMLRDFNGVRRLVILSDLQAVSWQPLMSEGPAGRLPGDTQVTVVELDATAPANVSIHLPRTDPPQPLLGQSVNLTAQLQNHSQQIRQLRVTARVDEQPLPSIQVELQPGERRDVAFESVLQSADPQEVVFRSDHDAFPIDDQCYWVAQSRAGLPVAIVSDDGHDRSRSADYFVSLALAPYGDDRDRFRVRRLSPLELSSADLESYSAVFVAYLGLLERSAAERLVSYVERGGACVFFCGQGPVKRNLLTLDAILPAGCLPWVPTERVDLFRQRRSERIATGNWRASLLRDFDVTSQIALSAVRFGSIWRAEQVRAEAEVLLSFADGTPALSTRRVGRGEFVLANFSPDTESSDLGKHGAFVALMQILAQNLRPAPPGATMLHVGQPLVQSLDLAVTASELTVSGPDGRPLDAKIHATQQATKQATHVSIDRTPRAGIYRLRHKQREMALIPVNLDPAESDLRPASLAAVRQCLQPTGTDARVMSTAAWQKPIDLVGRPLWGWMILVAMTAIATEQALLGWWRH